MFYCHAKKNCLKVRKNQRNEITGTKDFLNSMILRWSIKQYTAFHENTFGGIKKEIGKGR